MSNQKSSQSILDILNLLPLQAIMTKTPLVTDKEAKVLMKIFESDQDTKGRIILSSDIDLTTLSSLSSKDIIKAQVNGFQKSVEITDKGRKLIREIILQSEQSALEKKNRFSQDNFSCVRQMPTVQAKTASRCSPDNAAEYNWFQRLVKQWNS